VSISLEGEVWHQMSVKINSKIESRRGEIGYTPNSLESRVFFFFASHGCHGDMYNLVSCNRSSFVPRMLTHVDVMCRMIDQPDWWSSFSLCRILCLAFVTFLNTFPSIFMGKIRHFIHEISQTVRLASQIQILSSRIVNVQQTLYVASKGERWSVENCTNKI
jgi:hypothetical protein